VTAQKLKIIQEFGLRRRQTIRGTCAGGRCDTSTQVFQRIYGVGRSPRASDVEGECSERKSRSSGLGYTLQVAPPACILRSLLVTCTRAAHRSSVFWRAGSRTKQQLHDIRRDQNLLRFELRKLLDILVHGVTGRVRILADRHFVDHSRKS